MTIDQLSVGIVNYIEKEVAAPAPTGLQKFVYYAALPFVDKTIRQMAEQYKAIALSAGILSADGQWDAEALKKATTEAIRKSGSFQIGGIIFREEDLLKMWSYII